MYKLFDLKNDSPDTPKIVGYHFPCEDAKQVVVLIHGIGEYAGRYQRMADYFAEKKIAIVSMDLRGHGRTVGKKGRKGHCAPRVGVLDDITRLIKHTKELYPDIPVILYGHSMGGGIALDYRARGAMNGELDGYVISAPWLQLVKKYPKIVVFIMMILSATTGSTAMKSKCAETDLGNPKYVRPYDADEYVHPYITFRTAYEGFKIGDSIANGKNIDNGFACNIPTLIMHGTADKICDINGTRKFVEVHESDNIEYVEWEGYYHEIHNGGPNGETGEEPIKKAIDFISKIK